MKTNIIRMIIVAFLFTSCTPGIQTESTPTRVASPTLTITPEIVPTGTPIPTATEISTIVPSETPPSCLALLTPPTDDDLPATGRVTFSWSPVKDTIFYALNIVTPSGETVSFETKQPTRALFLEALPAGGTYQWKVIAEDRKRNEICSSELATFNKPSYTEPNQPVNDKKKRKK